MCRNAGTFRSRKRVAVGHLDGAIERSFWLVVHRDMRRVARIEAFIAWLRDEQVFISAEDLVRQMHEDSKRAREALARASDLLPPA